jgi:hypothetical protein
MKRTLAIVTLGLVALMTTLGTSSQREQHPRETTHTNEEDRANPSRRALAPGSIYLRRDTWYEFALEQFNPNNVDYGARIEERRQVFLDESVRNPYFVYSAGVTLALLLMTMLCTKQWIDQRRVLWITAEMMADLYRHDLYSRRIAEKAIRKYNEHVESCNHAIETSQHGTTIQGTELDQEASRVNLEQVTEERDCYLREWDAAQRELATNRRLLTELSLRLPMDNVSARPGRDTNTAASIAVNSVDPTVVRYSSKD